MEQLVRYDQSIDIEHYKTASVAVFPPALNESPDA